MKSLNDIDTCLLYELNGADWLIDKADAIATKELIILINDFIYPNSNILDLCCGYGRLTIPLLESGFKVTGVDISTVLVDKGNEILASKGINESPFVVGNMKNLIFSDHSFDFIFCVWASFNFLLTKEDQLEVLGEIYRTLNLEGRVLIELPFHKDQQPVVKYNDGDVKYEYFPFCVNQLEELFESTLFSKKNISIQSVADRDRIIVVLTK